MNEPVVVVEETVEFSLDELGRATRTRAEWLVMLVDEGVLRPRSAASAGSLRFGGEALGQVRRAHRVAQAFELEPHALALALQLMDRIEELERALGKG